jgi:RNA polymerase sigma-70 factor (ECF subfamily)
MDVRGEPETPRGEVYEDLRPLLFSIAYRIVSSVSEAEDIVQEAFLRFHRAQSEGADIDSPRAWLSTVTTQLAINQVRSARARRETYVGTWLPEPLLTDPASDASVHAETADSLSMAFLVLLESLSPVERAVFLLREVFDAIGDGDLEGLTRMLAADAVSYSDGGGKASAFPHPVHGREGIARVLLGFGEWRAQLGAERMRWAEVNGQPGALFLSRDGRAALVVSLDIAEGLVQTIRAVSNPQKLRHLGPRARRRWPVER